MYQPKTGAKCHCKPGIHRDNCPACEGTGWQVDFAAIRNRKSQETSPGARLEYLRAELRAERISYGELNELQSLAKYIQPDDVELREAAGLPEFQ